MKAKEKNSSQIRTLIGWDQYQYHSFIYETGEAYVKNRMALEARVSAILKTVSFWKWWLRQWDNRNAQFLRYLDLPSDAGYDEDLSYHYLEVYKAEHNPAPLSEFPHSVVQQLIEAEIKGKIKIKDRVKR